MSDHCNSLAHALLNEDNIHQFKGLCYALLKLDHLCVSAHLPETTNYIDWHYNLIDQTEMNQIKDILIRELGIVN